MCQAQMGKFNFLGNVWGDLIPPSHLSFGNSGRAFYYFEGAVAVPLKFITTLAVLTLECSESESSMIGHFKFCPHTLFCVPLHSLEVN